MFTTQLGSLSSLALALALLVGGPEWEGRAATLDAHQPAAAGATVVVANTSGSIQLKGWDKDEVLVSGYYDEHAVKVEVGGTKERVTIRVVPAARSFEHGAEAQLAIQLPRGARVEVETVAADVEGLDLAGRLKLEGVSGDVNVGGPLRELEVRTVSGDVHVRKIGERAQVRTVSGDITISDASGELELESVSGEIKLSGEAFSRLRAKAVSGDLEVAGDLKKDATVELESHSGDVKLRLPKTTAAIFEISTFSGEVESELGPEVSAKRDDDDDDRPPRHGPGRKRGFTLGSGAGRVSVSTFSGDVHLLAR